MISPWIFIGVAIFALLLVFIVNVRNYKAEVRRERLLDKIEQRQYESDLKLLEAISGKKIPKDKRAFYLTPTGHELVTWGIKHLDT